MSCWSVYERLASGLLFLLVCYCLASTAGTTNHDQSALHSARQLGIFGATSAFPVGQSTFNADKTIPTPAAWNVQIPPIQPIIPRIGKMESTSLVTSWPATICCRAHLLRILWRPSLGQGYYLQSELPCRCARSKIIARWFPENLKAEPQRPASPTDSLLHGELHEGLTRQDRTRHYRRRSPTRQPPHPFLAN